MTKNFQDGKEAWTLNVDSAVQADSAVAPKRGTHTGFHSLTTNCATYPDNQLFSLASDEPTATRRCRSFKLL